MIDKIHLKSLYTDKKFSEIIYILENHPNLDLDAVQFLSASYFSKGEYKKSFSILNNNLERFLLDNGYFNNFIRVTFKIKSFYESLASIVSVLFKQKLQNKLRDYHFLEIAKLYYVNNKHLLSNKYYKKILLDKKYKNIEYIYFHLGKNFYELNKKQEGEKYLREAIQTNNKIGEFYRYLSMNKKFISSDDKDILNMKNSLKNPLASDLDRVNFGFGLSKAYEDLKKYEESSKYLIFANNLMSSKYNYDHKITLLQNENLKKIYLSNFKEARFNEFGYKEKKHIFIVGMPRSGTTLLSQIISSHPEVFNGGELTIFSKYFNGKFNEVSNNDFNLATKHFHQKYLKEIGENYCKEVLKKTNQILVDKMPFNYLYLGFLKQALPASKIIHIKRDRNDNLLSIYKNFFATDGIKFAYDTKSLNQYYESYLDIMNFWKKYCPEFFYEVSYEELTNNFESEVKSLINYCDLTWNSKCLEPENNKSFVKTLSVSQAREKIYTSSVKKYESYKPYLKNLFN